MPLRSLVNARDRNAILGRIAGLQPANPRKWGRMNVHQTVCHLNDSFAVGLGERTASSVTGFLQRTLMKGGGPWVPIRWLKGAPTPPEIEQGVGGTPPGDFELDRSKLLGLAERFCDFHATARRNEHPFFGAMREGEWLRWGYLHTDHHLRQFGA